MKKVCTILIIFMCLIPLASCHKKEEQKLNYEVAVLETTSNVKKSKITYYDKELKETRGDKLSYAELGSNFNSEYYNSGEVYFVPRGMMKMYNEKKVISVNQKTGKITEYPIDRTNILVVSADDNYVYAGSNSDFTSYITQYNKKTGETKETNLPDSYVSLILNNNGKTYVFARNIKPGTSEQSYIYIYDQLQLKSKIEISGMTGNSVYKATIFDNQLIFSIPHENDKESNKLGILDLNTLGLNFLDLHENNPDDILPYKNKIIVSHTSLVQSEGTKISVIEWKSKKQKVFDLKSEITRIARSGNILYVLGGNQISSYDIENDFTLLSKRVGILSEGKYTSSIFTKVSPTTD